MLNNGNICDSSVTFYGGIMEDNKLQEIYNCLKIMDMILYKVAYEPKSIVGFKSTEDMAIYFRQFLNVILPKEYQYKNDTMAEW